MVIIRINQFIILQFQDPIDSLHVARVTARSANDANVTRVLLKSARHHGTGSIVQHRHHINVNVLQNN